ncbi:DUF1648 domain-containing protein [Schleiferilactobacillus perolens]|nr:DUF1648 domain-containing protein [Schleiferilactobacillus perolens]
MRQKSFVSRAYWVMYLLNIVVLLGFVAVAYWLYQQAPARIPDHWNGAMQIDAYGNKIELFIFPALALIGVILHPALVDRKYPDGSSNNMWSKIIFGVCIIAIWVAAGLGLLAIYRWLGR